MYACSDPDEYTDEADHNAAKSKLTLNTAYPLENDKLNISAALSIMH